MVSASFLLQDCLVRTRFFEKTFLLADTSMEMVPTMRFLAFSNADFLFGVEKLTWRAYIVAKALSTTSWVKLIDKKEFAKAVLV